MNAITTDVKLLGRSQHQDAIEVLAAAFNHDPLFRYFCSEKELVRFNSVRWFSDLTLRYSLPHNHIYTTATDLKGVAMWLPPGQFPISNWRLLQLGFYAVPFHLRLSRLWQFLSLFQIVEEYHKYDMPQPHWYLSMLGVAPAYQNQGVGSLLLQPVLQQADADRVPCYLETSTEGGVRFYQRQGFEVIRTEQLSKEMPRFWTMARLPQHN